MNVFGILRTAALAAVLLSAVSVDARRSAKKDCVADIPAAAPSTPGLKGSVAPAPAPAVNGAGATKTMAPVVVPPPAPVNGKTNTAPVVAPAATTAAPAATITAPANKETTKSDKADKSGKADKSDDGAATVGPAKEPATLAPAPAAGGATQSKAGAVKSKFTYKGKDAGGAGSYDMVTDFATCTKTKHSISSPIGPIDDDVTIAFRGPMTIHNIAVFDGNSGAWNKVSSYNKGGDATNMVFLNNRNIDFGGKSSPQGFATADGKGTANQSTPFSGVLDSASNPTSQSIYAEEKTGAEVHIMTEKQCGKDGTTCKGYYDKDGTAFQGWGGAKKIFVTKVTMPNGGAPNLPAIWMLNGQVVRSSQYQCNCRGMGKAGGCGELDIAEVIEKDTNVVATHYYFYEGGSAPGHDSFGKRPVDKPATYVTIVDKDHGIQIVELGSDDFDFGCGSITQDVVSQWQKA